MRHAIKLQTENVGLISQENLASTGLLCTLLVLLKSHLTAALEGRAPKLRVHRDNHPISTEERLLSKWVGDDGLLHMHCD